MNHYVTGSTIRLLREARGMTQAQLAEKIAVSDKAVSRWETGKGFPDITLLEPLAAVLNISVIELLTGDCITNRNISGNMMRSTFYVCPVCGNIIHTMGDAVISCCGVTLNALEADEPDAEHMMSLEQVEDETFVTMQHPMTKQHYIAFLAYVTSDKTEMYKLYPEGNAQARFRFRGIGWLYCYCNHHGLMRMRIGGR